eukprot:COSAG01_NODE_3963_length_5491_cov_83.216617_7_plen_98_part_00
MVELAGHWSHCGRHLSMTIKVWSCCHACRCVLWNVRLLRTSPSPTPSAGVELESCCLTRSARSFALHSPPPTGQLPASVCEGRRTQEATANDDKGGL